VERIGHLVNGLFRARPACHSRHSLHVGGIFTGRTFGFGVAAIQCPAPCLGWSFNQQRTVTSLIQQTLPVTASIATGAAVLWFVVGVSAGVVAALRRGTAVEVVMTVVIVGVSTPAYLVGLLAILVFGSILNWVPVSGFVPFTTSPGQWAFHLITPWCALACISAAMYARITRGQRLDVLGDDYIRTDRPHRGPGDPPPRPAQRANRGRDDVRPRPRRAARRGVITEKVFSMYGMGALLVEHGATDDILGAPRDPYTRALLAAVPVPDPDAQRRRRDALRADRLEEREAS